MPVRLLLATLAVLAAAPTLAVDPVKGGGLADFTGPRALALGGATGVISGNDGLFVNPGAVAARKRYSVETIFGVDRRGGTNAGQYAGSSVVDAISSPVAASFAWIRPLEGFQGGNLFVAGLAGSVASRLYLGAQARYFSLRQDPEVPGGALERISVVTADAGLFWEVSDYITLGVSGFNLVPTGHERALPRSAGAGLALGSDTSVKLTLDWRADFDRVKDQVTQKARTTNRFGAGVEVLLGNMLPLRAGYLVDETLGTSWWCAGAGLITPNGVAVDLGYRQSLEDPNVRVIAVAFKLHYLQL